MIVAIDKAKGRVMVVLEPGNIHGLMEGRTAVRNLAELPDGPQLELTIAYTPDVEFMFERISEGGEVLKALGMSLRRPPVFRAPNPQQTPGQVN